MNTRELLLACVQKGSGAALAKLLQELYAMSFIPTWDDDTLSVVLERCPSVMNHSVLRECLEATPLELPDGMVIAYLAGLSAQQEGACHEVIGSLHSTFDALQLEGRDIPAIDLDQPRSAYGYFATGFYLLSILTRFLITSEVDAVLPNGAGCPEDFSLQNKMLEQICRLLNQAINAGVHSNDGRLLGLIYQCCNELTLLLNSARNIGSTSVEAFLKKINTTDTFSHIVGFMHASTGDRISTAAVMPFLAGMPLCEQQAERLQLGAFMSSKQAWTAADQQAFDRRYGLSIPTPLPAALVLARRVLDNMPEEKDPGYTL